MRRRLAPFGIEFTIDADDERVGHAADRALARYPRDAGASGSLHLSVRTGTDTAEDPAWPHTAVTFDGQHLTLRCGSGALEASVPDGKARAVLPPSLLAVEDAVRMVVEGAFSALAINAGLLHAMHAGLVGHRGRGLVLRGASGAGKSTLTYALLRAGSSVASDDWTYAVPGQRDGVGGPAADVAGAADVGGDDGSVGVAGAGGGGVDRLWGYPWRLFLVPEAVARFPELAGAGAVLHPGADRLKVPVIPPISRRRRSLPVDAVVFLDPDPHLDLRRIDVVEARQRFWDCALPTERTGLPPAWVEALLARPTYRLNRGQDPDAAAALLQQAAATIR